MLVEIVKNTWVDPKQVASVTVDGPSRVVLTLSNGAQLEMRPAADGTLTGLLNCVVKLINHALCEP